jgi:short-subunit dehydrogenase
MEQPAAIITGGASGLGLEMARQLAGKGYRLTLVDKDVEALEQAKPALESTYPVSCETITMDLSVPGAADELYGQVECPELLVLNAGFGVYGDFVDTPWEVEEKMLQLHVMNLTRITKCFLPDMLKRGHGRMLVISSLAALQPGPLMNVYYASKAYMYAFSRALARELKGSGIQVCVVLPGLFNSGFAATTARNSGADEKAEKHQTTTLEYVARRSLEGLFRGKTRVIPGWNNRLMALGSKLLPTAWIMAVLYRTQVKIRK